MDQASSLFILSTGRTGTQFLARFFESLGIEAHHEPGPFWLREASNAVVSGQLSVARARTLVERARANLLTSDAPYVEASCLVYGLAEPLLEVIDTAIVAHVVRDPKTYIRSGMNWGVYRPGGRPLNLLPFRRLAPPQFTPWSLSERVSWARKDQFERLCWAWTAMNAHMRRTTESTDRGATVRFEDIFDAENGYPGLVQLSRMIGVEPTDEALNAFAERPVNAATKGKFPRWSDWTEEQREMVRNLCGEEAAHHGYDLS